MATIKLQEYANIKESSIEDIIKYAFGKGVDIPQDPEYILDDAILKAIDPVFQFNMKYRKSASIKFEVIKPINQDTQNQSSHTMQQNTSTKKEKPGIRELGKIDLDVLMEKKRTDKNDKSAIADSSQVQKTKKKSKKRVIGIVKFFDWSKDFGFVVTGNKGVSNKSEDQGKLYDFYINSSAWKSDYPNDGEWIVFTPNKGYRGWSALDCNRLSYDKEGLLLGMSYRGTYAKIFGKDSKGDSHDYNVLCHIIDSILRKGNDSQRIIIDTFAEYISGWNIDKRNDIIAQFLQDDSLCKKLISMLPVMKNYQSENSSYIEVINAMTTSIGNSGSITFHVGNRVLIHLLRSRPYT
ncbi:hypothetical protein [Prevotella ihumii]|uniref:hypothetical protein n=1 Tax=Prevotella ihumii TaxID=1917878 RepID=UPI00098090ED|nr:hypothetical protein [Prevotella ihumii]